jgi:signal peptidase I
MTTDTVELERPRRWLRHWVYIPPTLAAMVTVLLILARFEWQPFNIPSASMAPTIEVGDFVFVRHYRFIAPQRGDVAVFLVREDGYHYVKRIVGMPGDRLRLAAGEVYINGVPLQRRRIEDYQIPEDVSVRGPDPQYVEIAPGGRQYRILKRGGFPERDNRPEIVVPPDRYYMLGDNRDNSVDSRDPKIGFVALDDLVGRTDAIFWSARPSRIGKTID